MKTSFAELSKELELPKSRVQTLLNLMSRQELIVRNTTMEGTTLELTERSEDFLSSNSPVLYKEIQCIPQPYRAYIFQMLHLIKM